jgi:hypothetical protein
MASVRRRGPDRVSVWISIAEPLSILILPFQGCAALCVLGIGALVLELVRGTVPLRSAGRTVPALLMLSGCLVACLAAWTFAFQLFELDRRAGVLKRYRGPVLVETISLALLSHVEIDQRADGDGGSAQAFLCYRDGRRAVVNRVATGQTRELDVLAVEVNAFLRRHATVDRATA